MHRRSQREQEKAAKQHVFHAVFQLHYGLHYDGAKPQGGGDRACDLVYDVEGDGGGLDSGGRSTACFYALL